MKALYIALGVVAVLIVAVYLYPRIKAAEDAKNGTVFSDTRPIVTKPMMEQDDRADSSNSDSSGKAIVYPPAKPAATTTYAPAPSAGMSSMGSMNGGYPATDSIAPNPPNGMVFAGTGHFQLYRQGNLTWRVNTDNGAACIIFATDEEWRKAKVYRHGCGTTGRS